MKPSMQLGIGQKLQLTPQLRYAMQLLQMSNLELCTRIEAELETNPLLEELDDLETDTDIDNPPEEMPDSALTDDDPDSDTEGVDWDEEIDAAIDIDETMSTFDEDDAQISETDWNRLEDYTSLSDLRKDTDGIDLFENQAAAESLKDHLISQLNLMSWPDTDIAIGEAIIDSLDSDGFFLQDMSELGETLHGLGIHVEESHIEYVLRNLQSFDPDGVCARSLQECLLLQLQQKGRTTDLLEWATEIVEEHFELLCIGDSSGIANRMSIPISIVEESVGLIQTLNPRPAADFVSVDHQYIEPDIEVTHTSQGWYVELVDSTLPQLKVNDEYVSALKASRDKNSQRYLRDKMLNAKLLIDAVHYRNATLLKTAKCIVERQRSFFEEGPSGMQPLVLADIAAMVGVHESTISRVVRNKHLSCPKGVFALRYFFTSKLNTSTGGEISGVAIRALLKDLIDAENPKSPLSDSKITTILRERNIDIARRTVAKYREALAIPSSTERRKAS